MEIDEQDEEKKTQRYENYIKQQIKESNHKKTNLQKDANTEIRETSTIDLVPNKQIQNGSKHKNTSNDSKMAKAQKTRKFRRRLTPILQQTSKPKKSSRNNQNSNDDHPYTGIYTQQLRQKHQYRQVYRHRVLGGLRDTVPQLKKQCNCKRSHCLKLYCECFASGMHCSMDTCNCVNCYNNDEHSNLNAVGLKSNHSKKDETEVGSNNVAELETEGEKSNKSKDDINGGDETATSTSTSSVRGGEESQTKQKQKRSQQKQSDNENGNNTARNSHSTRSKKTTIDRNEAIYTILERNPFAFRPRIVHENASSTSSSSSLSVPPLSSSSLSYHHHRPPISEQHHYHARRKNTPYAKATLQHGPADIADRHHTYTITERDVFRLFQSQKLQQQQEQQQQEEERGKSAHNVDNLASSLPPLPVHNNNRSTLDLLNVTKMAKERVGPEKKTGATASSSSFAVSTINFMKQQQQLPAPSCSKDNNHLTASTSTSSSSAFASASSSSSSNKESIQTKRSTYPREQKGKYRSHSHYRSTPRRNALQSAVTKPLLQHDTPKRNYKIKHSIIETDLEKQWRLATETVHDLFDSIQSEFVLNQQQLQDKAKSDVIEEMVVEEGRTRAISCTTEEYKVGKRDDKSKNARAKITDACVDNNNKMLAEKNDDILSPPPLLHPSAKIIANNVTEAMQQIIKATNVAQMKVEKEWAKEYGLEAEQEKYTMTKQEKRKKRKRKGRTEENDFEEIESVDENTLSQISQHMIGDTNVDDGKTRLQKDAEKEALCFASPSSSSNEKEETDVPYSLKCAETLSPSPHYYEHENLATATTSLKEQITSMGTLTSKGQNTTSIYAQKELSILVAQDAALLHELAHIIRKQALNLASKRIHRGKQKGRK